MDNAMDFTAPIRSMMEITKLCDNRKLKKINEMIVMIKRIVPKPSLPLPSRYKEKIPIIKTGM
jgi:hypothetical protein